ncbi:CPBP family glutamic-type intramembrane protease [Maritimibacter sp. UBA3975]|uniref:CPBP family glutamic-type intramembrane protease n=1 Tax=Maritimibacter sp. UBA3975 TaxID=1946833 RepID=UPI000C0B2257|nr:CPBP family glutamic-type intramembrane protease [Maritimibacter sp. UBA3975]MAM62028.1 hypothetical protein [Maritimibacter sp.]|tara:strand:- start:19418 stop:20149 length:732 start_codon:yes stop_codon:yes gene_type:complete
MNFLRPFLAWMAVGLVGLIALGVTIDISGIRAMPEAPEVPDAGLRFLLMFQPAILMGLGVALGVGLSGRVGLHSWLTARMRGEAAVFPAVWLPICLGLGGGVLIALADWLFFWLRGADGGLTIPTVPGALAALTYGGIVEELMLRYGLLTALFWAAWKIGRQTLRPVVAWVLIAVVAVLFGLGHLPAMMTLGPLDAALIARTILLNAALGLVYGWLYWRRGLEARMVAHMATHPGMWLVSAVL